MARIAIDSGVRVWQECNKCNDHTTHIVYEDNKIHCTCCFHTKTIGEKEVKEYEGEVEGTSLYTYNNTLNLLML